MKMQLVLLGALCCQVMGIFASDAGERWDTHEIGGKIYEIRPGVPLVGIAVGPGAQCLSFTRDSEGNLVCRDTSEEKMAVMIARGDARLVGDAAPYEPRPRRPSRVLPRRGEEKAEDAAAAPAPRRTTSRISVGESRGGAFGDGRVMVNTGGRRDRAEEERLAALFGLPHRRSYMPNADDISELIGRHGAKAPVEIGTVSLSLDQLARGNSFGSSEFTVTQGGEIYRYRICDDGAVILEENS